MGISGAVDCDAPFDRKLGWKGDNVEGLAKIETVGAEGGEGGDEGDGGHTKGSEERVTTIGSMGGNKADTAMDMMDARLNRIAETTTEFRSLLIASPADLSRGSSDPPSLQESVSSSQETLPS